jgi:hypothetical protein
LSTYAAIPGSIIRVAGVRTDLAVSVFATLILNVLDSGAEINRGLLTPVDLISRRCSVDKPAAEETGVSPSLSESRKPTAQNMVLGSVAAVAAARGKSSRRRRDSSRYPCAS